MGDETTDPHQFPSYAPLSECSESWGSMPQQTPVAHPPSTVTSSNWVGMGMSFHQQILDMSLVKSYP